MCAERFPNETELTAEICNAWASRRGNESVKTTNRRLPFIREFARHLIRGGEQAYILPIGRMKDGQRYIPHIYSQAEVVRLWRAFDDIRPTDAYPAAHIVLPVLIRLLYCCGLRPSEALNIKTEDVSLQKGTIFIAESKGNKDRLVVLSDDVKEMFIKYDTQIRELLPSRRYFFARNATDAYAYRWLSWTFERIRDSLRIETRSGKPPRLYDLRHTFATHRLYQWMRDGKELYAMLPYLSAYMGHAKITETLYYVHLVPGMLETMSGFKYASAADLFPKAVDADE